MAALLFAPAGTLAWPRGWIYLGVIVVVSVPTAILLLRGNEGLVAERLKPPIQKFQPLPDKLVVILLLVVVLGQFVLIPLDVFHWHLLSPPGEALSLLGLALFLVGWWMDYRVMRENAFAAPVVKYQEERGHYVIDTGPYAVVRHPMYSGAILFMLGGPLFLQSSAAAIATVAPALVLALRIGVEEAVLRRELAGYDAYRARVRWRLVPHIW